MAKIRDENDPKAWDYYMSESGMEETARWHMKATLIKLLNEDKDVREALVGVLLRELYIVGSDFTCKPYMLKRRLK